MRNLMNYTDIDPRKKAFVFELDDVLYPKKDYLYQVYYLFASMLEYTDHINAKEATDLMVNTYLNEDEYTVYNRLQEKFSFVSKYKDNFERLILTAKLPLKLLLYKNMLNLLQEIVIDRKKVFIVTDGEPQQQLNKIKQTEWHGLEKYLTVYFTRESRAKPEPDVIDLLLKEHHLQRKELVMIGNAETDLLCAETCGIDFIKADDFL